MSGGVDSSVAASMLKDTGYDVVGIGLQLVDPSEGPEGPKSCCGICEMEDAFVEFHSPQKPTAPGQSVVLYDGDMVVGEA